MSLRKCNSTVRLPLDVNLDKAWRNLIEFLNYQVALLIDHPRGHRERLARNNGVLQNLNTNKSAQTIEVEEATIMAPVKRRPMQAVCLEFDYVANSEDLVPESLIDHPHRSKRRMRKG